MSAPFPARCFVQAGDGRSLSEEAQLVQAEMTSRGIPCETRTAKEVLATGDTVLSTDLFVGDFEFTRAALRRLGVKMPEPPDYPPCLQDILHRKVWRSTLGEVAALLAALAWRLGLGTRRHGEDRF